MWAIFAQQNKSSQKEQGSRWWKELASLDWCWLRCARCQAKPMRKEKGGKMGWACQARVAPKTCRMHIYLDSHNLFYTLFYSDIYVRLPTVDRLMRTSTDWCVYIVQCKVTLLLGLAITWKCCYSIHINYCYERDYVQSSFTCFSFLDNFSQMEDKTALGGHKLQTHSKTKLPYWSISTFYWMAYRKT